MAELQEDGTVSSRIKPIVTVLTEGLLRDFVHLYHPDDTAEGAWWRANGTDVPDHVSDGRLRADVEDWLMNLQDDATAGENAQRVIAMIRKNPGWIDVLTRRVARTLRGE